MLQACRGFNLSRSYTFSGCQGLENLACFCVIFSPHWGNIPFLGRERAIDGVRGVFNFGDGFVFFHNLILKNRKASRWPYSKHGSHRLIDDGLLYLDLFRGIKKLQDASLKPSSILHLSDHTVQNEHA